MDEPRAGAKSGSMEFESRLRVFNGVLEALEDKDVSMCSICGVGGMGKTRLAERLVQRVEADRLFSNVAMVTISQNPDFENVQCEIVESLGLKIHQLTMRERAKKLKDWLSNNKTLLILDDVWQHLSEEDFENVGIPLGSKRCKIVLTSRDEDECRRMGSQRSFRVDALENEEAWDLFRQIAGKRVEELDLEDIARKIVDECNGLPVAIVVIAHSLRDEPKAVWEDDLQMLQNLSLQSTEVRDKVYSRLKLSYDRLDDEEVQACVRLFCLFPEDSDVSVEQLAIYMKGLRLLEDSDSIAEARNRVEAITNKLYKPCLLLDGQEDGCFKMHDVVRDFALSITSDSFLVRHDKEMVRWPKTLDYENCNAISLEFDKVKEHPLDLSCPKLELLMLSFGDGSTGLSAGIFDTMTKLRVLILHVPSLLQPLFMLKELRALIICETLDHWDEGEPHKIGDLLGHGDLQNLEIFSLISERPCNDFPEEIGLLCNLRFLHLDSVPFEYLSPGVLSKLVKLEVLQLPCEFISWGCKEENGEESMQALMRLNRFC